MRIFLIGSMGAGKTYWGQKIASHFDKLHIDLDEYIALQEKVSIPTLFDIYGEAYFRMLENKYLVENIALHKDFIMSCGGGTPCFKNNKWLMHKNGKMIYLKASIDVLLKRILLEKQNRPLIASLNDFDVELFLTKQLQERSIIYSQADFTIDVNSDTEKNLLHLINQLCTEAHL